ncbi:MAG: DUF3822 family protein [Muribaculaceae bacterium]|nr:DUF3822 family protein [Muribaculaceae bacterium]
MSSTLPDHNTIERPRLWRLALQLERELLRAVVWSTVEDSTLLQFSLPLDPTLPGHKALEEAVYAAPVLLSDFGRVDVVVRQAHYMAVPHGLDSELQSRLCNYACLSADPDSCDLLSGHVGSLDADIVWPLDSGTASFLARTFRNPAVHCHITPLLRYFSRKTLLGNSGKLYAHFHECAGRREVDIIAFGTDGSLALTATHPLSTDTDAIYYILASMQQAGLDARSDEILLCGHGSTRDALMPALRKYAAYVMPVIFPSAAFRAGREALQAPFPLIVLPLCE